MSTTKKTEPTAPEMGVFSTAGAMALLWQKAAPELHTHELEWFADGAVEEIKDQTQSLADVLMNLGALVASDDGGAGSFMDARSASLLLFNLSHQVGTLNGLVRIATDASDASYRALLALKGQP